MCYRVRKQQDNTMKEIYRTIRYILLAIILGVTGALATGCSSENEWDQVPQQIQEWLAKYFPGQCVSSVDHSGGQWRLKLKNSCSLTFNDSLMWTNVNGNGGTLPAFFVSDALPPQFVEEYLQVTDNVDNVYAVTREKDIYTVVLQNYTVQYNEATGETTQVPPQKQASARRPSATSGGQEVIAGRTLMWLSRAAKTA